MIKAINNFLTKGETDFLKDYWETREPSLKACGQCDKAVSTYADFTSESLLRTKQHLVEEAMGIELLPTYSFSRLYYNGSELTKHVDRPSCEVSVTLCIFADKEWPIWFHELKDGKADPNKKPLSSGVPDIKEGYAFLVNEKVDQFTKESQAVLTANDQIIWVCGKRIADWVKLTPHTQETAILNRISISL